MVVAFTMYRVGYYFFDETVDRIEPGGSLSNADFEAEFDVIILMCQSTSMH